jgi:hypothetical protein
MAGFFGRKVMALHSQILPGTLTSTAMTIGLWSMNASTIAVVASAIASVAGVILQFWLAFGRIKKLEAAQILQVGDASVRNERITKLEENANEQS